MKTCGIALENWKLPIFKKTLDREGYKYVQHKGLTNDTVVLKIKTESIAKLQPVIERMNAEAARLKHIIKPE